MLIVENNSDQAYEVLVAPVNDKELKLLTKTNYWFTWRTVATTCPIFKLTIEGRRDILGVMALRDFPAENRMEIHLLACSRENVGVDKKFEGIAACLIAYASGEAFKKCGGLACVSLIPKTALKHHYIQKCDMIDGGWHVYLDGHRLLNWAKMNL